MNHKARSSGIGSPGVVDLVGVVAVPLTIRLEIRGGGENMVSKRSRPLKP